MDKDVEFMERSQLKEEVRKLRLELRRAHGYTQGMLELESELKQVRQITQTWLDQQGHNRCWYYPELFVRLAELLGLKMTVQPSLPPRAEFEAGCKRYQHEEFGNEGQVSRDEHAHVEGSGSL